MHLGSIKHNVREQFRGREKSFMVWKRYRKPDELTARQQHQGSCTHAILFSSAMDIYAPRSDLSSLLKTFWGGHKRSYRQNFPRNESVSTELKSSNSSWAAWARFNFSGPSAQFQIDRVPSRASARIRYDSRMILLLLLLLPILSDGAQADVGPGQTQGSVL